MSEIYAAGAVAAFTIDLLVYPLDTLKTRYQSQDYVKNDATRKPLALRGLYQGIGSVILATVPAAGVFFSTYENTKNLFSQTLPLPNPLIHSSASAVAEMASCLVLAPAEVIKQNAQMLAANNASSRTATATTTRKHGSTSIQAMQMLVTGGSATKRLFTGYSALVARNLPFTALQFPAFEHLRERLGARWRRGEPDIRGGIIGGGGKELLETGLISGVSAGGAGALAAYITTPSDVVKTRMMLSVGEDNDGITKKDKPGAWMVTKKIYEERGLRGFFRGALFRSGWTMLGSGLYLGTYDVAKVWLRRRKRDMGGDDERTRL